MGLSSLVSGFLFALEEAIGVPDLDPNDFSYLDFLFLHNFAIVDF